MSGASAYKKCKFIIIVCQGEIKSGNAHSQEKDSKYYCCGLRIFTCLEYMNGIKKTTQARVTMDRSEEQNNEFHNHSCLFNSYFINYSIQYAVDQIVSGTKLFHFFTIAASIIPRCFCFCFSRNSLLVAVKYLCCLKKNICIWFH